MKPPPPRHFTQEEFSVSELQLRLDNPRLGRTDHEDDCIVKMFQDTSMKMMVLISDMTKEWLWEDPIVVREKGKVIVYEGNRRVAALKVLNDLNKCRDVDNRSAIGKCIEESRWSIPDRVVCRVLGDKVTAKHYIRKYRHGRGQDAQLPVQWVPMTEALSDYDEGGYDGQYAKYVALLKWSQENDGASMPSNAFRLTVFERLLGTEANLRLAGFKIEIGENQKPVPKKLYDQAGKILARIITQISDREVDTATIELAGDRTAYLAALREEMGVLPENPKVPPSPWEDSLPADKTDKAPPPQPRPTKSRETLIPSQSSLKKLVQHEAVVSMLVKELSTKKKITLEKAPRVCSLALRVLFEFSVDNYITTHRIHINDDAPKLVYRLTQVKKHMQDNGVLDRAENRAVGKWTSKHHWVSIDTMNQYIHSKEDYATAGEVRKFWDEIEPFILKCWGHIEENGT